MPRLGGIHAPMTTQQLYREHMPVAIGKIGDVKLIDSLERLRGNLKQSQVETSPLALALPC